MEQKTITDYTIYCTESQTRKAFELGAPIEILKYNSTILKTITTLDGFAIIPTAEQMISWLRKEKAVFVEIFYNGEIRYSYSPIVSAREDGEIISLEAEDDPDIATLAAIDAALEYLTKNKK